MKSWKLKIVSVFALLLQTFVITTPGYTKEGKSRAAEFLCELGISYYCEKRYREAIHELKKALLVDPKHKIAREYLKEAELALERVELGERARWEKTKEKALRRAMEEAREKLDEEERLWLEAGEDISDEKK